MFFLVNSFMGKDWEAKQVDKLVKKQKAKIAELQTQVERDYPANEPSSSFTRTETHTNITRTNPEDPNKPINS